MIQSKLIFFSFLFFTGCSVHGEHKSEKSENEKSDLCANDWVDATFFGLGKLKRKNIGNMYAEYILYWSH